MTPWTIACQAPLSLGFSRQEYWSGLPLPSPGDLSDPKIEPGSLMSPELADGFFTTDPRGKPKRNYSKKLSGFPGGSDSKASAGDPGSIPGSGRSPGEGNGNPLQHFCLESPMDRGA